MPRIKAAVDKIRCLEQIMGRRGFVTTTTQDPAVKKVR
jgi:hypothetical protein